MAWRGQGRGRAPCCEKEGLKRGPWTQAEDQKLIAHIMKHGHSNWRNLPKQAGLLRCGKSCRLRWVNYLRPDVKRGSFTEEEEENIIKLHTQLGNKWSKIASCLPGRTDNEIKNVWHTHIKKRLACREANRSPWAEEAPKQESCEAMQQQNMVSNDYYSTEKKSTSDQEEAWIDDFSEGMMDFVMFPGIWSIGEELGGGYSNFGGQEDFVNQWLVNLEKEIDLWQ